MNKYLLSVVIFCITFPNTVLAEIAGAAPMHIQTEQGDRFSGVAWEPIQSKIPDYGLFCATNDAGVNCYGIYDSWSFGSVPMSFNCTDGSSGRITVALALHPSLGLPLGLREGQGVMDRQQITANFGESYITNLDQISCRAPLVIWENAGADTSIFPKWEVFQ